MSWNNWLYADRLEEKETIQKPKTNADRIRAMSDVSLAEELVFYRPMQNDFETHVGYFGKWTDALKAELKWLQQPADKGE